MVGEWVVIGADPNRPGTLGHQFYLGSEKDDGELQAYRRAVKENAPERFTDEDELEPLPRDDPQFQRLLFIRVTDMKPAIMH